MSESYVTISIDTFERHWSMIKSAMQGYKPIRNYESFVLLEADKDSQTFSMRVANGQGGLHAVIDGHDQPSPLTVHRSFAIAIQTEELTRVVPFLKGTLDITPVDGKPGEIRFIAGTIEQHLPWSSSMVEDFPSQWSTMTERARFTCADFARRLRLGSNSASRNPKDVGSLTGSTFIQIGDDGISIESAGPNRGVSRMAWKPEDLTVTGEPFAQLIPLGNVLTLARMASNVSHIVVTNDPGGGQIVWKLGNITYFSRTLGSKFYPTGVLYSGVTEAEASVPVEPFTDIVGLVRAQTTSDTTAKATITMLESGEVLVTSPSTYAMTSGRMHGMCGGVLPRTFTMNAGQVVEILSDLNSPTGLVHLDVRAAKDKMGNPTPILRIGSPDEPDYIHVAVLLSEVVERNTEVQQDADQ